ncbi:MAG: TIGR01244 family sulfur transferase [Pseudomonadota bacterium]
MPLRPVTPDFAVAPQIAVDEIPAIAAAGYKTVIVNRPDGEDPGQPTMDEMRAAAEAAGMTFVEIPVVSGRFTPDAVDATRSAIETAGGPVFAYCRSGTRSVTLWALAEASTRGADAVIAAAADAGYDLSPLRPHLQGG